MTLRIRNEEEKNKKKYQFENGGRRLRNCRENIKPVAKANKVASNVKKKLFQDVITGVLKDVILIILY